MTTPEFPQAPQTQPIPEAPAQKPEVPTESPLQVAEAMLSAVKSQSQQQSQNAVDQAIQQIFTPPPPTIAIQLPVDDTKLIDWSHLKPDDAAMWYALSWFRLVRKAVHFGWKMLTQNGQVYVPGEEIIGKNIVEKSKITN